MWNKKLFYVLNCLKCFRECPKSIQWCAHLNKIKNPVGNSSLFQTLYFCKVAKTIIAFFLTSLTKGCLQYETEKKKNSIEFCTSKLVLVPNFSLNWNFCVFGPKLPKMGIPGLKQKNWTVPLNFGLFFHIKQKIWTPTLNSVYSN